MSYPYIGEVRMHGGNFAPVGWLFCHGQQLPIFEYEVLYTLIGTTYGGDGVTTFNLPNLASRLPLHTGFASYGVNYVLGQAAGVESVTLTPQQLPPHTHAPLVSTGAPSSQSPQNQTWANWSDTPYSTVDPTVPMSAAAIGSAGGDQPHDNMSPYVAVSFIIAVEGIYPSSN